MQSRIPLTQHADVVGAAANLFTLAIEASPAGMLLMGPEGEIALVNRAIEQQFGYASGELIGQPVEVLLPESLLWGHEEYSLDYAGDLQPIGAVAEFLGRRKDNVEIPVEVGLNTIHTTAGLFVLASVVDVSERRHHEEERLRDLQERLGFERLVAEISGKFFNLETEQIDDAIQEALRSIGEALDLDRNALYQLSEEKDALVVTHQWTRPGQPLSLSQHVSARDQFPWSLARIREGQVVSFSSAEEVPDALERETLRYSTIKSRLAIPFSIARRITGAIDFATTRHEREWTEEMITHLNLVAQVLVAAIRATGADTAFRATGGRFRESDVKS